MPTTSRVLRTLATVIANAPLHRGDQFAQHGPMDALDICAWAYCIAEDTPPPAEFFTDELASIRLIECSPGAMQAIKTISAVLDTHPADEQLDHGITVPNFLEHVSNWARTAPVRETKPPSVDEVIGRILRAADYAAYQDAACRADALTRRLTGRRDRRLAA
ncbi:hypothetical protein [Streptomyces sp. t39]|uniref:hypothetical protein n=1 Tax=Streptomyces sp. t39 TaxID=1828156 RepID=UPI0011CE8DEE|nr:hypothetical protein [Streptomyces sp. t39]TXS39664.1 hypothetical protein EAO77_36275 [Streptomyces sp. t39]